MKKLKKILLINWLYFDRELIEVGVKRNLFQQCAQ